MLPEADYPRLYRLSEVPKRRPVTLQGTATFFQVAPNTNVIKDDGAALVYIITAKLPGMVQPPRRRASATENAEAAFKAATSKPADPVQTAKAIPTGKELVSIRLDRDLLEHFQEDGAGWQERINAALRTAAGLD